MDHIAIFLAKDADANEFVMAKSFGIDYAGSLDLGYVLRVLLALVDLVAELEATNFLGVNTEAIAQADGSHMLGTANWIGRPLGLHCTAAGKVFLAHGAATRTSCVHARATPPSTATSSRHE